ncbi:hypothetical protein GSI_09435 [Ganoderma sinense ZZ0214-1]|uniref:Transporter n=1 Tax=Ganoderma sinense ZZ0214-1 TaxID=1077348 RepID=A0A2G8S6I5_9APHY|nr:hypothetical protein GSI_09435 [Ganoderma sinense ZZ0214-1]
MREPEHTFFVSLALSLSIAAALPDPGHHSAAGVAQERQTPGDGVLGFLALG